MSAEVLRRAAALMRDRAEGATPGPWNSQAANVWGSHYKVSQTASDFSTRIAKSDAIHIASWHPAVALAVADLLDVLASATQPDDDPREDGLRQALAVANAYLSEATP